MPAARKDFTIEQGSTWIQPLVYKTGNTPNDLTDYTAKMQIRDVSGALFLLLVLF